MPVPAGISRPMITFSLRPRSWSTAPCDGGVRQDLGGLLERGRRDPAVGAERGLGDPQDQGLADGRLAALGDNDLVGFLEMLRSTCSSRNEIRIAHIHDFHPAHHLAHDDFDVLVVDAHPLQTVDFLDLVHQISARATSPLMLAGCPEGWRNRRSGPRRRSRSRPRRR